jgi:hypothetical protein
MKGRWENGSSGRMIIVIVILVMVMIGEGG